MALGLSLLMGSATCFGAPLAGAAPLKEGVAPPRTLAGLKLQLLSSQPQYALGEPVLLTMRITYDGGETLSVTRVDFDRSGRVGAYSFSAKDETGQSVPDPTPELSNPMRLGGGPIYFSPLAKTQPYTQSVVVNAWLAFPRPGHYFVRVHAAIVRRAEEKQKKTWGKKRPFRSTASQSRLMFPLLTKRPALRDWSAPTRFSKRPMPLSMKALVTSAKRR